MFASDLLNAIQARHHRRIAKRFDRAVSVQQLRRGDRPDPRNSRISVRRVADQRKEIGDQQRFHAELLPDSFLIANVQDGEGYSRKGV